MVPLLAFSFAFIMDIAVADAEQCSALHLAVAEDFSASNRTTEIASRTRNAVNVVTE